MHLIVGLGNPGRIYKYSRHNVGSRIIDALAKDKDIPLRIDTNLKSVIGRGEIFGKDVLIAKPLVFMNLAGEVVKMIVSKKRILANNLLVVYDDIDLGFKALRLKPKGGCAGHKGMTSIIDNLGTRDFARLKIGIGRPTHKEEISDYVLSRFTKEEERALKPTLDDALNCCLTWIKDGVEKAMEKFNIPR